MEKKRKRGQQSKGKGNFKRRKTTDKQPLSGKYTACLSLCNLQPFAPTEENVGITQFVSQSPGYNGIIKQRISDFVVHEIDLAGNIARLTSDSLPEADIVREQAELARKGFVDTIKALQNGQNVDASAKEELECCFTTAVEALSALDGSVRDGLLTFLHDMRQQKPVAAQDFEFSVISDKAKRSLLHECIRQHLPFMNSYTRDNRVCMKYVGKSTTDSRSNFQDGAFLKFILYKANMDTIAAINSISHLLHMQTKSFSYAGTKDKRGMTSQWITAHHLRSDKLMKQLQNKRKRDASSSFALWAGNFCYVDSQLKLGDLKGNHFTIILRDVDTDDNTILDSIHSLRNLGFINYFGMQRFGTGGVSTHLIGKAMLKQDWELAVGLILAPRDNEASIVHEARSYLHQTGDIKGAYERFPGWCTAERTVLDTLGSHGPNSHLNALQRIPRNLRSLYVHAYQSFVWNSVVSARVSKFGCNQPVVGDMVMSSNNNTNTPITSSDKDNVVHCVTEADIMANIYSITDLVLPLPGFKVSYPTGDIGQLYEHIMTADGISSECFSQKHKELWFCPGDYRKICCRPPDMQGQIIQYTDPLISLIPSDVDTMVSANISLPSTSELQSHIPPSSEQKSHTSSIEQTMKAVKLEFSLPSSSYATMAIRELTKQNTSVIEQKKLATFSEHRNMDDNGSVNVTSA